MMRPWALPLLPLYAAATRAKNLLYDWHLLPVRRLQRPVISIGSLSAGGAGKTPLVLMLAELLHRQGVAVDVLSRGYGRGSGVVEEVDPNGPARRFGDEPVEMARQGLKVWVGADRFAAGVAAENASAPLADQPAVHLLDDGFQHRRLARDLDVVLLTAEDARDWLLPAGNLREPLAALRRADIVVVRDDERDALAVVDARAIKADVWIVRRWLRLPPETPKNPLVFCGIARPQGFFAMVRGAGCAPAGEIAFPDHHPYTDEDVEQLAAAARHAGADGFLTTAKDAVKIPAAMRARLEAVGRLTVAELHLQLADEDRVWQRLRQAIAIR
jgi:tetraacyldisaccharide 4'-kinase